MDPIIDGAARALAVGDPLGALKRVGLREDAPGLALRGIAMGQLGDFARAKLLLRSAERAFGPLETVARARCTLAEAEIALASRDLGWSEKALKSARSTLEKHGDLTNAAYARYLEVRWLVLVGRIELAVQSLAELDPTPLPPAHRAAHELAVAGIAIRRMQAAVARSALKRALQAAQESGISSLIAEVTSSQSILGQPAARQIQNGINRLLSLDEVETLMAGKALVIDGCRSLVCSESALISLAKRPILFELARALGEAWPQDVTRDDLVECAFGWKFADDTYRPLLRVEIGRLRAELRSLADIKATKRGFALQPIAAQRIVVLTRPIEEEDAAMLALLADGESWSSSALALALGKSQRTIQRGLESLAAKGKVQWIGHGRARRWLAPPVIGFTTSLLLPTQLPL